MKIETIEITNYKAFYGKHKINVAQKNIFIYGENGSGKSSLYYALKDFFQSSREDISLPEVENHFIPDKDKGKCAVQLTFSPKPLSGLPNKKEMKKKLIFQVSQHVKETQTVPALFIHQAAAFKGFLTYKNLLDIHHLKKDQEINLFNLLIKGVLKHFRYSTQEERELGELWEEIETRIKTPTHRDYSSAQKIREVNELLKFFNDLFSQYFDENHPDYILKHTQPILDEFRQHVKLKLTYTPARADDEYQKIIDNHVHIELTYAGKPIPKPHMFLNEARLSAIAISIYLGMIKRHPQGIPYKILFLDDIFIGLDIANRLPLLKILKDHFTDYQIFLSTYDKPWYEFAKSYLERAEGWKTMEFYAEVTREGYEIPRIFDEQNLLDKARMHLEQCDYKAAAVYTRSEFERLLARYCEKKGKRVTFKRQLKNYSSQDFWNVVTDDIPLELKTKIEQYRDLVLNAFSHYNSEKHEIKTELFAAMAAVEKLKKELDN